VGGTAHSRAAQHAKPRRVDSPVQNAPSLNGLETELQRLDAHYRVTDPSPPDGVTPHHLMRVVAFSSLPEPRVPRARGIRDGKNELMLSVRRRNTDVAPGRQSIIASIGLYADPALQSYVQGLGRRSRRHPSGQSPVTFRVVDDPVQRVCDPRWIRLRHPRILAHHDDEAELATVMATDRHVTLGTRHTRCPGSRLPAWASPSAACNLRSQVRPASPSGAGRPVLKFSRDNENRRTSWACATRAEPNYDSRQMVE